MSGRKPLPSAVKEARGNPGKRGKNDREPQAPAGIPPCPPWLSARARELWSSLGPMLLEMRVLTLADAPALELLCDTYAEWREAREVVEREGMTYECEQWAPAEPVEGEPTKVMIRQRPEVAIAADAAKRLRAMLTEFGLTPSARTRVKTSDAPSADPVRDLMDRGAKLRARNLRLVKEGT